MVCLKTYCPNKLQDAARHQHGQSSAQLCICNQVYPRRMHYTPQVSKMYSDDGIYMFGSSQYSFWICVPWLCSALRDWLQSKVFFFFLIVRCIKLLLEFANKRFDCFKLNYFEERLCLCLFLYSLSVSTSHKGFISGVEDALIVAKFYFA